MEKLRLGDLTIEELTSLEAGAPYITVRRRNAWHSTEVWHYQGPASLVSTLEQAKAVAEGWRRQGSEFIIRQVPALVLRGPTMRVVLTEFHTHMSFAGWDIRQASTLENGGPMSRARWALSDSGRWERDAPAAQSFVSGVLSKDEEIGPLPRSFKEWISVSAGGDYVLNWFERPSSYAANGVRRILGAYREVNRLNSVN